MNLPNPFLSSAASDAAADTSAVASPSNDAAAGTFTYSALEAAMPAEFGHCPGLTDSPDAVAEEFDAIPLAELAARGFDVDAFMIDLEPVPLFLRPVIELLAGYA